VPCATFLTSEEPNPYWVVSFWAKDCPRFLLFDFCLNLFLEEGVIDLDLAAEFDGLFESNLETVEVDFRVVGLSFLVTPVFGLKVPD
jgi:hypothetical protein